MGQPRRSHRVCRTPQPSSPNDSAVSHDFRQRLRTRGNTREHRSRVSKDTPPRSAPKDVLRQLDACFAFGPARSQATVTLARQRSLPEMDAESEEAILELTSTFFPGSLRPPLSDSLTWPTDALTQRGRSLYESVVDDIAQAHGDIEQRIVRFSSTWSATLSTHDKLYDNIGWPLGQTRCSDSVRPRATLSVHFDKMSQEIESAKNKLIGLENEWKMCFQAETDAWEAMHSAEVSNRHEDRQGAQTAAKVKDSFKKKARAIATATNRELEDVEVVSVQRLNHAAIFD